jgi:hypothetical protein
VDLKLFLDTERNREFNTEYLEPPNEFSNWANDEVLVSKYFDWIRTASRCASLKLDINSDVTEVVAELKSRAVELSVPHRPDSSHGWRAITLYGYASNMTDSENYYREIGVVDDTSKMSWTDICQFFPKTVNWIKTNIPFDHLNRTRIMILEPGGFINPHRDHLGQMLGAGINVAFTHPDNIEFGLEGGGLVPWKAGEVRLIDIARHHAVVNNSNEYRIHLIVYPLDRSWNMEAKKVACRSYDIFWRESKCR